jgi:hypothetical protein
MFRFDRGSNPPRSFAMSIQAERWTPTEKEGLAGRPAVIGQAWSLDKFMEVTIS